MTILTDLAWPLVLTFLLLVALLGVSALLARSWRSNRPHFIDRWRIARAVIRYDFWLELRGVGRRRRRDLREELRANLDAAAERVGAAQAVAALGSLRQLSADATSGSRPGPRWSTGASVAAGVLLAGFLIELVAIIAWAGAAEASGAGRVEGALPLFPGSQAIWDGTGGGISITFEPGWLVIAAVAAGFVLGSRPWLAVTRRRNPANRNPGNRNPGNRNPGNRQPGNRQPARDRPT
jgi:hypothetical protein